MARHKSAIKRSKKSVILKNRNVHNKSSLKTAIKSVLSANDLETAKSELNNTISLLDKMEVKGIIHKNKAANQKSRLARYVNSMA